MSPANYERQNLKQRYGEFYNSLVRLLADYDPMLLVRGGLPDDEYEPEVDAILLRLPEANSPKALGRIIYGTFVEYFGSTFAPPDTQPDKRTRTRYNIIGKRAWKSWKLWEEKHNKSEQ